MLFLLYFYCNVVAFILLLLQYDNSIYYYHNEVYYTFTYLVIYSTVIVLFICSYILLHHVMGELDGRKGAWAYVEGGMGAVSAAIAKSAVSHGVHIFTEMV